VYGPGSVDARQASGRGRRAGGGVEAQIKATLAIGVGAILGANLRYALTALAVERFGAGFPYGTLFINVTGSVAIGFFLTLAIERFDLDPYWRLFFATGFLGAYTTFSWVRQV
jgi:fluoride exporter